MSRSQSGPSRPLGNPPKPKPAPPGGGPPANVPRRSAGALPGLARTASTLRQSSPLNPAGSSLASLPAHLRNLSTPRIPSPLGKGTPARGLKQSLPARTSKTTERHVFLPEDLQLRPFPGGVESNPYPIPRPRSPPLATTGSRYNGDERSDAEKMTKREREENKLPRLTAYCTAEGYRLKLLAAFLKREHGVGIVRVYDDCVYAVYTLPLLPGYSAGTKIRSSPASKSPGGTSLLERMELAEDVGYEDAYFPSIGPDDPMVSNTNPSEYILSHSPPAFPHSETNEGLQEQSNVLYEERNEPIQSEGELGLEPGQPTTWDDSTEQPFEEEEEHHGPIGTHMSPSHPGYLEHVPAPAFSPSELSPPKSHMHYEPSSSPASAPASAPLPIRMPHRARRRSAAQYHGKIAEAVFFEYGVSVFFGFQEDQERDIMDDCETAGVWQRGLEEDDWETEAFHYTYDPDAEYPRIFNDMFTFKSSSHLFKLSLAHAISQSTKLSIFESVMQESLSLTSSLPKELAITGHLQLSRRAALKMTGRLFKLRMDVNLIGGILDTPELFWSEASLFPLYEAIHEYLEIGPRTQVLNDRLSVAGDLLEVIHEYIQERGADRETWIVIWLIVVACLVELGEVLARLVFHQIPREAGELLLVKGSRAMVSALKG